MVTNTDLKDLKSALKFDHEPDLKLDLQSDLRLNLKTELNTDPKTELRSSKPVEVAEELVRAAKLGEPVLVDIPRADPEQEAAMDNAGRACNELEEDKVDKKEDTVTGGSGIVKLYASKGVVYTVRVMSKKQGKPVGKIKKRGKPVGKINEQGSL
jgi:hypothetical protein